MVLHERMKELQVDSDVKVRTLAGVFGVQENALGNYLNGKRTVPYEVLVAFAQYYQVTTDYLLGLTDDPQRPYPVSKGERALLERLRSLRPEQRELIAQNVEFMYQQNRR